MYSAELLLPKMISSLIRKIGGRKSNKKSTGMVKVPKGCLPMHVWKNFFKRLLLAVTGKAENANKVKIRRGFVAIYVGAEDKRYEVPVKYLSFLPLQELMNQSLDDHLDIKVDGPIKLASCTPELFYQMLKACQKL